MPLSDAGEFRWRGGASTYIFVKDYSRILELAVKPLEDIQRASDGTLRTYSGGATIKRRFELEFENIGATQLNRFATIWKRNTVLAFFRKRTDTTKAASVWWVDGYNFVYGNMGMIYKDLWDGRIILEET